MYSRERCLPLGTKIVIKNDLDKHYDTSVGLSPVMRNYSGQVAHITGVIRTKKRSKQTWTSCSLQNQFRRQ